MSRMSHLWSRPRPLWQRIVALACFVVPASAAIAYFLGGPGVLVADLVVCLVILSAIALIAHRLDRRPTSP